VGDVLIGPLEGWRVLSISDPVGDVPTGLLVDRGIVPTSDPVGDVPVWVLAGPRKESAKRPDGWDHLATGQLEQPCPGLCRNGSPGPEIVGMAKGG
jgi:hypothetical protein